MSDKRDVKLLRRLVLDVNFYGKTLVFISKLSYEDKISNQACNSILNAIMEKTHALEITADKFWK